MWHKIYNCIRKHAEVLLYLVFGFLTTVVNFLVYFPLHNGTTMLAAFANVIAWCAAVIFAFLTNKPFVFKSKDWSQRTVFAEAGKFIAARLGSLVIETGIIYLAVDVMRLDGNFIKIITSIIVVILNYLASKLLVFK
jgi:putative flippase GtrA